MSPRRWSSTNHHPLIFTAGLMALLSLPAESFGQDSNVKKPRQRAKNVVILLADDLGWGDVGFHGSQAVTRNIDQLAKDGLQLNRFYAFPACSPARAAMLTGRFPRRYGIVGPVRSKEPGLPVKELLLPAVFQAAGYQTSLIGKWHLGKTGDPKSHPIKRGFDQFYGFQGASIDYFQHTSSGRRRPDWQRDGKEISEDGYSTDLLSSEAVRQINERDKTKPFCMVVSFNAPHSPFQAPEHLIAKYSHRLGIRDGTYAAMIESMDIGIGRILDAIDKQQLRNDTVVVFTSDNGAAPMGSNRPLRGQKREVYEGGIRVPCVIRAPGVIQSGTQSDQLSAIHDLFPTLASAVGVSLQSKRPLDGRDLWNGLVDSKLVQRSVVIAEQDHALIHRDWKLIETSDGYFELYNLANDPNEQNNRAVADIAIVGKLKSELAEYKKCFTEDLPIPDTSKNVFSSKPATSSPTAAPIATDGEGGSLANIQLTGDANYGVLGDPRTESNGYGIRLLSGTDVNNDKVFAGDATMTSQAVNANHRWYRFLISGFARDGFEVDQDDLYLKVEFLQNEGTDSLDLVKKRIYPQVVRERADFRDESTNDSLGHGIWRSYALDFRTPFSEIDTVKLSVGFNHGKGASKHDGFWIRSMDIQPIDAPQGYQPAKSGVAIPQPAIKTLTHLGGRWYYNPKGKNTSLPKQFDYTNADQLLYKSDRLEVPFAGNMSSWLRKGYKSFSGELVDKDQAKPFSVVITFTNDHLVMRSRNLPNHPTATFPDRWRMLDGNPAYIQEQANTWNLPLRPMVDPRHIAMTAKNANNALPMGPIGVATNGVVFFNPFDHIFETDAVWRLDRCCGHPSPQSLYHYHKYPVCVKTPWSDEGSGHSTVIGFAFDGFPVYGPYESAGLLAKNAQDNPLNEFNLHEDEKRGPHYHVTPGKFPHIIGGYWGASHSQRRPSRQQGR